MDLHQETVTRQILWNISLLEERIMYILTIVSVGIAVWGFWRRFQVYRKGQKQPLQWDRPIERAWITLKQILTHKKLNQRQPDGFFHFLVFWGFLLLLFVTFMVGLEHDTPLHFFYGWTYLGLSFLGDLGGVMMVAGLLYFNLRRYVSRAEYIKTTRPLLQSDGVMHTFLGFLVFQGFALEIIRLAIHPQDFEKVASFVGSSLGLWLRSFEFSEETLTRWHHGMWLFHMVTTMGFIAALPFTKLSHVVLGWVNTFTQNLAPKGALLPIAFDKMENAESFGVAKMSELTMKQRMSVDVCVECGRCEMACPAFHTQKPLSPKAVIVKMRDRMWAEEKDPTLKEKNVFETGTLSFDELFSCTTCGACVQECPVNIEHVPMIMDLRRYLVMTQGQVPGTAGDMVRKVQNNGNPWGIAQEDRMKWTEGLQVPIADPQTKVDYLYYIGCAGAYDDRNKKVARSVVELLTKAGVSFAIIGKDEKCNGDPVRRIGDEYAFNEIAVQRVEQLNQYKFDKVVTHCPHCFHTIGSEYGHFGGTYKVVHHTQLLAELLEEGRLKPTKNLAKEVVFHDPCYLGRHHGEFDAPREILKSIPGLIVRETERSKEKSFCCGMGGGNMWYESSHGTNMTTTRMDQLVENAPNVATSCSFCLINFEYGKSTNEKYEKTAVTDVAEYLKESCT